MNNKIKSFIIGKKTLIPFVLVLLLVISGLTSLVSVIIALVMKMSRIWEIGLISGLATFFTTALILLQLKYAIKKAVQKPISFQDLFN